MANKTLNNTWMYTWTSYKNKNIKTKKVKFNARKILVPGGESETGAKVKSCAHSYTDVRRCQPERFVFETLFAPHMAAHVFMDIIRRPRREHLLACIYVTSIVSSRCFRAISLRLPSDGCWTRTAGTRVEPMTYTCTLIVRTKRIETADTYNGRARSVVGLKMWLEMTNRRWRRRCHRMHTIRTACVCVKSIVMLLLRTPRTIIIIIIVR